MHKIKNPDAQDDTADFPMDLSETPQSLDSQPGPGWELQEDEDSDSEDCDLEYDSDSEMQYNKGPKMRWVPVDVDRDGWRYQEAELDSGEDLEETLKLIGKPHARLKSYFCMEWRRPYFNLIAHIDCVNGIWVNHNVDLYIPGFEKDRPDQRWSGVAWKLWTTVCPNHRENLRYIIRETITNTNTKTTLKESGIARGKISAESPQKNHLVTTEYTPTSFDSSSDGRTEPTYNEKAGDCDFYTILHTPNVIGIVFLLMAHAKSMNYPYISRIVSQSTLRVAADGPRTGWNMVIELDRLPC